MSGTDQLRICPKPVRHLLFGALALWAGVMDLAAASPALQSMEGALAAGARPTDITEFPTLESGLIRTLDTLIVNPAAADAHTSIQSALDARVPGNTTIVRIAAGDYEERVRIFPKSTSYCALVLEPLRPDAPPLVQWTHDPRLTKDDEGIATIEILNRHSEGPTCRDFRVAIWGLKIRASGDGYGSAISCRSNSDDVDQEWLTGIDLTGNDIRCTAGGPAVLLGERSAVHEVLWNQSAKWGWIRNNVISTSDTHEADGGSSWHFVGFIQQNEIAAASEGWHLGLARTDARHYDRQIPQEFREAKVEHNYIHCATWNAFHFTHGSTGCFRNNVMRETRQVELPDHTRTSALGLYVGPPGLGGDEFVTRVDVHNNIAIENGGSGFMAHFSATMSFGGNISVRNGWGVVEPDAGFGFELRGTQEPVNLAADYNVFHENRVDYSDPVLEGPHDLNEEGQWPEPGQTDPRFVGAEVDEHYSFALSVAHGPHPCGHGRGRRSPAIDAGPPRIPDEPGGGLGEARNDCGIYGGPAAIWDPLHIDPCAEMRLNPEICGFQ